MFAVADQTVTIGQIEMRFGAAGDDVSKSVLEIAFPSGAKAILSFNTRGQLIGTASVEIEAPAQPDEIPTQGGTDGQESQETNTQEPDHAAEAGGEVEPT